MSEKDERLAVQGPRGPKGEQGTAGLSHSVRSALVFLFALSVLLAGANLLWTAHEVHASAAGQQQERVAAQRAGVQVEVRLCTTLGRLAALRPPAGNPVRNPARAYDQQVHATLAELGPDIGCRGA